MIHQPLISVIVPVYKVEEYLDRCVESLVSQTYNNIEIILVDDGSPDSCSGLCDRWIEKDCRIIVMHKTNGGLSDTRNDGVLAANGEYISFVDSDDWIDTETYLLVMNKIIETGAQIGAFNMINVGSESFVPDLSADYEVLDSEKAIGNTISDTGVKTVAWNKVYQRSVLEGLSFPKDKLHEDEYYTFRALDKADKIVYLHRQCYYYFQRPTSIMGQYNIKHIDMLEGVKQRMELVKERYPRLYRSAKLSLSSCCMFQYQNLLKHKDVDADGAGRKKVKRLRRSIKITKCDVAGMSIKAASFHRAANSDFGLDAVCRIKNLLGK